MASVVVSSPTSTVIRVPRIFPPEVAVPVSTTVIEHHVACDACGRWRSCGDAPYPESASFTCKMHGLDCDAPSSADAVSPVGLDSCSKSEVGSETHRYLLSRCWDELLPQVLFVMHNPSTANSTKNDSTMRRCYSFSVDNHFGGFQVVNLFAWRGCNPRDILARGVEICIGNPRNDVVIADVVRWPQVQAVCLAWGALPAANKAVSTRADNVLALLARECALPVLCLERTRAGWPRHPLYIKKYTKMIAYVNVRTAPAPSSSSLSSTSSSSSSSPSSSSSSSSTSAASAAVVVVVTPTPKMEKRKIGERFEGDFEI